MPVKAKFKCSAVTHFTNGRNVTLNAVTSGSEENKAFWQLTPIGKLDMNITNPDAFNQFEPGKQ